MYIDHLDVILHLFGIGFLYHCCKSILELQIKEMIPGYYISRYFNLKYQQSFLWQDYMSKVLTFSTNWATLPFLVQIMYQRLWIIVHMITNGYISQFGVKYRTLSLVHTHLLTSFFYSCQLFAIYPILVANRYCWKLYL